jgi:HAD superfamily hydrolase (TIGR01459 family)
MQLPAFKHISEALDDYDLFLFDLWGVVIEDEKLYPGVIESINNILKQKKVFFVSNAPRPAFTMKEKLQSWGLEGVTEEMIVTSGDVARELMLEEAIKRSQEKLTIYHLGADQNDDILSRFNHNITHDYTKADVFLLTLFRDENQNIREFDSLLKNIAKQDNLLTICANPDISVPKGDKIRHCAGYFAQIIEEHGGEVIYTGKPKDIMYKHVLKKAGNISKNRILMIGDTFETDILGAQNSGINSALVLTGNARKLHSMHESLNDKLSVLGRRAAELKMFPTFITELA